MKINKNFAEIINKIRNDNLENRSHTREVVHWVEEHRLRSGAAKALVFILPTKGCSWALSNSGGCSICGYIYDNPQQPDFEKIIKAIRGALKGKIEKDEKYSVKFFTSGSFLDNKEIPTEFQIAILDELKIYNQIDRAHREFTLQQIEFISNIVRLYRGKNIETNKCSTLLMKEYFPDLLYRDVPGLCKVVNKDVLKTQGWSLNPGRFVGIKISNDEDFDFKEQLNNSTEEFELLTIESKKLEQRISKILSHIMEK